MSGMEGMGKPSTNSAPRKGFLNRAPKPKAPVSLEKAKTAEQFFEAFDVGFINQAFVKLQRKSGVPEEKIVTIPPEAMVVNTDKKAGQMQV